MAPPPSIDFSDDLDLPSATSTTPSKAQRTLLLAPPSVAAHPTALSSVTEAYDRSSTDIQMLDRLALGLVSLPEATYDLVLLLTDADGSRLESKRALQRDTIAKIFGALKAGGKLRSQDGQYPTAGAEATEAVLAGLVQTSGVDGVEKPVSTGAHSVPLRLGKKADAGPAATTSINGKRKSIDVSTPAGVGFIDDLDDLDGEDEELIDEDDLLTEEDKARPVMPRKCTTFLSL